MTVLIDDEPIPLISIVLPTKNRLHTLRRAINSALHQVETDFELIIIDDGSSDGTSDYLEELSSHDLRIKTIFNQLSVGGAKARNQGISVSRGKWLAFLDDDDEWLAYKIKCQLEVLQNHPNAVACSSWYWRRRDFGFDRLVKVPNRIALEDLLGGSVLGGASVCISDAKTLKNLGGFDSTFKSGQDWDLWVRLRQVGEVVTCMQPTVIYRWHNNARISNDMEAQYLGIRRFYQKYKAIMMPDIRQKNLAYMAYIQSRRKKIRLNRRMEYLKISIYNSNYRVAISFILSSFPRILIDLLFAR